VVDAREVARWLYGVSASYGGTKGALWDSFLHPEDGGRYGAGREDVARKLLAVPVMPSHVRRVRLPQFKILKPVVCPIAVAVMDDFLARERSPEVTRHHHPVLTDSALRADHLGPRPVIRREDKDIPALRDGAPTLPPRGVGSGDALAGHLGRKAGRDGPERLVCGADEGIAALAGACGPLAPFGSLEVGPAMLTGDDGTPSERRPAIGLPVAGVGAEPPLGAKEGRVVANLAGTGYGHAVDYSKPIPLFVELCAGLASMSLMLQGGRYARPPVSRMGNKFGYGVALHRIMGLRPGQGADRYLWCEPDPGCRALLHAYTDREVMHEAARIIRSWKDEEPRALWERLRAEGPIRLAEWSALQGGCYGGFPINEKPPTPDYNRWPGGKHPGDWPQSTADAFTTTPTLPATVTPDARPIEPADLPPGTVCFMDPPYVGTTGYGNDLPREDVVALARRWRDAGARVYISEAEPLPSLVADGWHAVEITSQRKGQKRTFGGTREWVTCSHEPAWRPAEQVGLFGQAAPDTGRR